MLNNVFYLKNGRLSFNQKRTIILNNYLKHMFANILPFVLFRRSRCKFSLVEF